MSNPLPITDKLKQTIKALETAPQSSGKTLLQKHLDGVRLTGRQMCLAKCADCMGYYVDGRYDCGIHECPIYPVYPYKNRKPQKLDE